MSISVGEIYASLKLEKGAFEKGLHEGGLSLGTFAKLAVGAGAVIGGALIGFGGEAVKAADDVERANDRTDRILGKSAGAFEAWAAKNELHLRATQADLEQFGSTADQAFQGMGISASKSLGMTEGLLNRAADISHLTGRSFEDVFTALLKGSEGATRGMKGLGVVVDQNQIKQEALRLHLWSGKGALDASAKAAATYSLIMKETASSQGAAAARTDSLAEQTKLLPVLFNRILITASSVFIPIATAILPAVTGAFAAFGGWLSSNMPEIKAIVSAVGSAVGKVFSTISTVVGGILGVIGPPIKEIVGLFADASDGSGTLGDDMREMASAGDPLVAVVQGIGGVLGFLSGTVLPKISGAFSVFTTKILPPLLAIGTKIATDLLPVIRTLAGVVGTILTGAFDALSPAMEAVGSVVQAISDHMDIVEPIVLVLAGALGGVLVVSLTAAAIGFAATAAAAVAAALATAAAWLVAMAPFLLIGAAIAALVVIWLNFHDQIVAIISGIATAIANWIGGVRTTVVGAFKGIVDAISGVLGTLAGIVGAVFGAILAVASAIWGAIRDYIRGVLTVILVIVTVAVAAVSAVIQAVWGAIGPFVLTVMGAIRDGVSAAWHAISSVVSTVLGAISAVVSTIWHAISAVISTVIRVIAGAVGTGLHNIQTNVAVVFGVIRAVTSTVWGAISGVIRTVWGTISGVIGAAVGTVKSVISTAWSAISAVTSTIWNGILAVISGVVSSIEGVARGVSGFLGGVFNAIAGVIKAPINAIIGAIDAFIGWWDSVSFSVPSLDLGPLGKIGGFNISLPYLSGIPLLASGGIVSSPTLAMLGENARPEAVIPLDSRIGRELLGGGGGEVHNHYHVQVMGNLEARSEGSIARTLQRLAAVSPTGSAVVLGGIQRQLVLGSDG